MSAHVSPVARGALKTRTTLCLHRHFHKILGKWSAPAKIKTKYFPIRPGQRRVLDGFTMRAKRWVKGYLGNDYKQIKVDAKVVQLVAL
jgi:hypothetical protein